MIETQFTTEVIIESTALVTKSTDIQIISKTNTNSNTTTSSSNTSTNKRITMDNVHVQLTITHGNMFHPHSKLTIIIPPLVIPTSLSSQSSSSLYNNQKYNLQLKIGEYNLFEEECNVTFELSSSYIVSLLHHVLVESLQKEEVEEVEVEKVEKDVGKEEEEIPSITLPFITLMGSYNQFMPKCKVYTNQIGNGNIFHSFCDLCFITATTATANNSHGDNKMMMIIGNGNIFQSFVIMKHGIENTFNNNDDDDMNIIQNNNNQDPQYQNQVFFIMSSSSSSPSSSPISSSSSSSSSNKVIQRFHDNGYKKNMDDVRLLLSSMKGILQKYHI